MGDTFEKRRREQKKRQKKKDKEARKNERDAAGPRTDGIEIATLEDIVGDLARPERDESDAADGADEPAGDSATDAPRGSSDEPRSDSPRSDSPR